MVAHCNYVLLKENPCALSLSVPNYANLSCSGLESLSHVFNFDLPVTWEKNSLFTFTKRYIDRIYLGI